MNSDQSQRFLFSDTDIRGEWVHLSSAFLDATAPHYYPNAVNSLLGEFMAASALLGSTLKFDGTLTLQARADSALSLIMAEYNHNRSLRCIAQHEPDLVSQEFSQLLGNGTLALTIDPADGQRYQGVVPLQGENLAQAIAYYYEQSEQIPTCLVLASNDTSAAGIMIQALPASDNVDTETRQRLWQDVEALVGTITAAELLKTDPETLLYRLFHQESLMLYPANPLRFECSCSQQRIENTVLTIGEAEARDIIEEQGSISATCEFCNTQYSLSDTDLTRLFPPSSH